MQNLRTERNATCLTITLSRESSLNSLNSALLLELQQTISSIEDDVSIVLFRGSGRAFSAGADLKEMAQLQTEEVKAFLELGKSVFAEISSLSQTTISYLHGFALGGGLELAMACDLRICHPETKLGLPESTLNLLPGFGGTQRLQQIVGIDPAYDLIASGRLIEAQEAHTIGLVDDLRTSFEEASTLPPSRSQTCLDHHPNLPASYEDETTQFLTAFKDPKTIQCIDAFLNA